MTEFPYVIQYEQFKLVKTIMAEIGETPNVEYRFSSELIELKQHADSVTVSLRGQEGEIERLTTPWIIGCDGYSSAVRTASEIEFKGFTTLRFKIGTDFDFEARHILHPQFFSDPDEWCNLSK